MKHGIEVYGWLRKFGAFPEYEENTKKSTTTYRDVPVFTISEAEMKSALQLDDLPVIADHCRNPLILTDRRRVIVVDPQGYDYARYMGVIHRETATEILRYV